MAQVWVNARKAIKTAIEISRTGTLIRETSFCHDGEAFLLSIHQGRATAYWLLRTITGKAIGAGSSSVKSDHLGLSQSALLPAYRGRGLYQAVIKAFLEVFQGVCSDNTKTMTEASTKSWTKIGGKLRTETSPPSKAIKEMFASLGRPAPKEISVSHYCLPGQNKRRVRQVTAKEICGSALK